MFQGSHGEQCITDGDDVSDSNALIISVSVTPVSVLSVFGDQCQCTY